MSIDRNKRQAPSPDEKNNSLVHQYKVGQTVRLRPELKEPFFPDQNYRIIAILPARNESPQYRVRNSGEPFERVVTQEKIAPQKESDNGKNQILQDKTFGNS
ncbi:hypothetical protein [Roseibium album]|uniref:hypothetical protein n=1 Tax=Roseibium album TaxID=311410 RepID=UPI002492AA8B|nr:hypothetical protein [Roseibium album]MCR9059528.1 hypothetical protein [Paracoccaceae bacterium]